MRRLIPFEYADPAAADLLWVLLALGGLSLLLPVRGHRVRGAVFAAGFALFSGLLHRLSEGSGWLWPFVLHPHLATAIVLFGLAREPLVRAARGPRNLAIAWTAALGAAAFASPFGIHPLRDPAEWALLAAALFGVAAIARTDAWPRRVLARGTWAWAAAGVLALCVLAEPFGIGVGGGVAFLLLGWFAWGVSVQGPEMRRYVKRRLLGTPVVLFLLVTLSYVIVRAAPGDPFAAEKTLDEEVRRQRLHHFGLDDPPVVQYGKYVTAVFWEGDLKHSWKHLDRTVAEIIGTHIGPSAVLGAAALCLALLIGLTAGIVSGIRRNSIFDYASMTAAMLGLALPTFIVGPLLVLVFAMKLKWFSVTGWSDFPRDLVLPAITLALPFAARIARLTRAGMLEVVHQDYIRTARAKGLPERTIVLRHTLKGALLPVVSFLGPAIAQMLTGSLVVETIFGVPGIGFEFVNSAINRDYFLALGLVILFGALLVAFNLIVDIVYAFLDPRIRHG